MHTWSKLLMGKSRKDTPDEIGAGPTLHQQHRGKASKSLMCGRVCETVGVWLGLRDVCSPWLNGHGKWRVAVSMHHPTGPPYRRPRGTAGPRRRSSRGLPGHVSWRVDPLWRPEGKVEGPACAARSKCQFERATAQSVCSLTFSSDLDGMRYVWVYLSPKSGRAVCRAQSEHFPSQQLASS